MHSHARKTNTNMRLHCKSLLATHNHPLITLQDELPEDNRFETEVGAGATGVVCTLTQLDANAEISPVWALVTDEKNPIDCEASFLDGEGVTGNGGLGRPSKAADDAAEGEGKADEPLEFVIHALKTQVRRCLNAQPHTTAHNRTQRQSALQHRLGLSPQSHTKHIKHTKHCRTQQQSALQHIL